MKPCFALSMMTAGLLLSGCGSDSNSTTTPLQPKPPTQEENLRPFDNVFGALPSHTMAGSTVYFYWNERENNNGDVVVVPPKSPAIVISGDEVIT